MGKMTMSGSRHGSPRFIRESGPPIVLERVTLGRDPAQSGWREREVQKLVHDHPDVLPIEDIEPAFAPLIAICEELPCSAGYLDNLWLTPAGGIVLGECKLTRNPEARRQVLVQALDYARAFAACGYEDLENAVRAARKDKRVSLWNCVAEQSDLTEAQFIDAVERRLRLGRFLILIIGDGIQEGVEALTSFLQLHAGLHTNIALVDLSLWRGVDGGLVAVPRIPMKTVLVERGIVNIDPSSGVKVVPPIASTAMASGVRERPVSSSEPEFLDQLATKRPELSASVQGLLRRLADIGVEPEFRASLLLRRQLDSGDQLTVGQIDKTGKVWLCFAWASANKLGRAWAADQYQAAVAKLVGGSVRTYPDGKTYPEVFGPDGKAIDLSILLAAEANWLSAIATFIESCATPNGDDVANTATSADH